MFVENCCGINICSYEKMVFGKKRTIYYAEQFDTELFSSGNLYKCRAFCIDWAKGTKEIFK